MFRKCVSSSLPVKKRDERAEKKLEWERKMLRVEHLHMYDRSVVAGKELVTYICSHVRTFVA